MSSSFISKFVQRHHLSLKLVGNSTLKEASHREEVIQESVDWLESLQIFVDRFNINKSQIKAIDKTYLCTSPWHKYVRHLAPSGSTKSRKIASDRGVGMFLFVSLYYALALRIYFSIFFSIPQALIQ